MKKTATLQLSGSKDGEMGGEWKGCVKRHSLRSVPSFGELA